MESLKFDVGGSTAFFKVPEVNAVHYFTYGNIHKPALLGMLGAIEGLGGYSQQKSDGSEFPEYYGKLKHLSVSVIPLAPNGCFSKKIQKFNNSVGYASQEQGGNLIISEQWLENPKWTIYIKLDCREAESLAEKIVSGRCVYMPYLGKNDHPATLGDATIVKLEEKTGEAETLDCILPSYMAEFDDDYEFFYREFLPYSLDPATNQYVSEKFVKTDADLITCTGKVYEDNGRFIVFY